MRTEFIGTCTVALSSMLVVLSRNQLSPGLGGLSISYALSVSNTFNWMGKSHRSDHCRYL